MNIIFHLYSHHPNCGHCGHAYYKMDQDKNGPPYCSIVSSEVEPDYYCSFYRMREKASINAAYTPAKDKKPTDEQIENFTKEQQEKDDKEKPKKL